MVWYNIKDKRPEDGKRVVIRYKNPLYPNLGVRMAYGHSYNGTICSMRIGEESWILEWSEV